MNDVNESSPAPSLRRLPFSVRLAPHFVNCLLAVLPEDDASEEIEGLLFGVVETGFSVLRMFHLASPIDGLGRQANFDELLKRSKTNPQLAGFSLLGWFSVRNVDGIEPDDIAFHERNFQKSNDLALIVKVEPEGEFSLELYCRSADGTLTSSNFRSGTIRVSNASPITSPLEVPMEAHQEVHIPNRPVTRESEDDDSLTLLKEAFASSTKKAIEVLKTGKPEQREEAPAFNRGLDPGTIRNGGLGASTPPAFAFGGSTATAAAPARIPQETLQAAPQSQAPADLEEKPEAVRTQEPKHPVLPEPTAKAAPRAPATPDAVLVRPELHRAAPAPDYAPPNPRPASPQAPFFPPPSKDAPPAAAFTAPPAEPTTLSRFSTQALRALPWRALALIFVVVALGTFGVIYLRTAHANGALPQFLQGMWPAPGLDLKIAANGDRFQLSWNRNIPAVRNAREAVLDITDGPNRHQILLGNSELGNGSVLYLPSSDDVVFRLQVHGGAGQNATESLRVVGTAKSNVLEVSRPNDIPNGETAGPGSTLASNKSSHENAKAAREPITAKPERARTGPPRAPKGVLAAGAGAGAVPKPSEPQMSSAARAPGGDTSDAPRVAANVPAPTSVPPTPPRTDAAQTRDAEAPPPSASPSSPVEKTNTADTAQLSKPDEPIHALDNNAAKSASVPPAVPARVSPPKASAAAGAQAAVTYNPPRPLKQVLPKVAALPPGAADAAGEVRVVVRVDESGRVIDARILDGRKVGSMLASAALTAAKQWIFEPASLRGKNIASDHTIVFQFRH